MKTTVELPDALLRRAKTIALRRRISFKQLLTKALQREVYPQKTGNADIFKLDEDGLPYIPSRNKKVTDKQVAEILNTEKI